MSTQVQFRRGTTAQTATFTGATAEITIDTTKNTVVVHDGSTAGGVPLARESTLSLAYNHANAAFEKANATAQQAFTTVSANGVGMVADANTDTFTLTSANGVALYGNATTDTLLINLALSGVTSGTYGGSSSGVTRIPVITVNDNGITTALSNVTITTDSVPETTSNLYFTATRVRANVTNTAPINYDSSTGTFSHATSGVTASGYGDSISIPVFVVTDKGHISAVTNTTIRSTSTAQTGVVQLTDSISSTSTTTAATPNAVKTAYDLAATKFASAGGAISGDVSVTGNLTVTGQTTYANTQTVLIADNILTLNAAINQSSAPTTNAGVEVDRGSSANVQLLWNETTDKWTFTNDGTNYYNMADADRLDSAYAKANTAGTTSVAGIVQLTDSITSTSTTTAATANAAYTAYQTAAADALAFSIALG